MDKASAPPFGGNVFNIVLVTPEIPANTGNIGRTCVVTGSRLHELGIPTFWATCAEKPLR